MVTIYAVKNPFGNNTDLNEKLSRAKEYLTKDEILDALLDDDGNLSPNLTNNKELEVGCNAYRGFCLRVKSKARSTQNDQLKVEANTCHVRQARENWRKHVTICFIFIPNGQKCPHCLDLSAN